MSRGRVAGHQSERVGLRTRRDGHVQPDQIGLQRAGVVLEPGHHALRDPGEQDGQQIGTVKVNLDGKTIAQAPLVAIEGVEEGGFFRRLWDALWMWWESV